MKSWKRLAYARGLTAEMVLPSWLRDLKLCSNLLDMLYSCTSYIVRSAFVLGRARLKTLCPLHLSLCHWPAQVHVLRSMALSECTKSLWCTTTTAALYTARVRTHTHTHTHGCPMHKFTGPSYDLREKQATELLDETHSPAECQ